MYNCQTSFSSGTKCPTMNPKYLAKKSISEADIFKRLFLFIYSLSIFGGTFDDSKSKSIVVIISLSSSIEKQSSTFTKCKIIWQRSVLIKPSNASCIMSPEGQAITWYPETLWKQQFSLIPVSEQLFIATSSQYFSIVRKSESSCLIKVLYKSGPA